MNKINEKKTLYKKKSSLSNIWYRFIKRTFDIVCALIGCLILIPLTIIIKIASICSGDFAPIFYNHPRIGKNGKEFKFYKFRSMVPNADEELKKILATDSELAKEYKKNKKFANDPRITKIGRFIRKTSLDEFPQFINVLKGDMSMIGNRPYMPREKADMGKYYNDIVKTKCGIISYWAVSGRSNVSFEERLKLEAYYSNNMSLKMDTKIFLKVFKVVLCGNGAK